MSKMDIVIINPGDRRQVYQDLGDGLAGIEPPFWVAVIAAYLRNNGIDVAIIDANAENITPAETAHKVKEMDPLIAVVIVYGSQPSASTQNMSIAGKICTAIREKTETKIAIGGLHPSALPRRTLLDEDVDYVIEGEGPFTIIGLIKVLKQNDPNYSAIPGLWYKEKKEIMHNNRAPLISDLDNVLPIAAWDLLPMKKYKAHNWHCFDDIEKRMPYGAIYTSLGCPYSCVFCCINTPFGKPGIRYRSPELIIKEIEGLVKNYGIKNIKIVDELFVLNEAHYMTIVDSLLEKKFDLNFWVYARVDTVKPENLLKMKKAGINWMALGIESANPEVRDGAKKKMRKMNIAEIVKSIQDTEIRVIGNYIFGLPDDNYNTMQETLDLATQLNCEYANFYTAMAYPGSKLYEIAIHEKWHLPKEWHGFSQHSYETQPLPTKYVSAKDVLKFRDDAFHLYFENPTYLNMIENKFGIKVKQHIQEMTKTRLKRKLTE